MRRKIVAGNWKLHGSRQFANELLGQVAAGLPLEGVDVVILPPLPYLGELVEDFGETSLAFGAQDVSSNEKGAYTGEVCAAMLVEVGARYGLVGHSERRQYHHESSELVFAGARQVRGSRWSVSRATASTSRSPSRRGRTCSTRSCRTPMA